MKEHKRLEKEYIIPLNGHIEPPALSQDREGNQDNEIAQNLWYNHGVDVLDLKHRGVYDEAPTPYIDGGGRMRDGVTSSQLKVKKTS